MPLVVPYAPSQIYQPNGRLVDLLRLQGEQSAEAQRRAGEIQAQMWSGLGNAITSGVGNVIKAQQDAPINALNQQKVKDAQALSAGQQKVDSLLQPQTPQGPAEGGGNLPAQHPYLDANGLYDIPKLTSALASSGIAHLAPELLKGAESINASVEKHQQTQQALGQASTLLYGDMADGVTKMVKAGIPFDQALDLAAAPGIATQRFDPQQFAQLKGKLLSLPPDQRQAALGNLMDAASKVSGNKTLSKDAQELDRYGRVVASNVMPELGKGDYTINGQRFKADGTPIGTVQPSQTAPKGKEAKSVLLDGKPAEVIFDPDKGRYFDAAGTDVSNRVKPIPSAAAVAINAGQLSDVAMEQAAKKYLDTGVLPPGFGTAGTIQKTAIMNAAAKLDPQAALARNQATFKADSANLTNLQKTEGTLSAFENTAGKNLDQFLQLADKIPDTGVPWLNVPVRNLSANVVGSENMAAINAARDVALREIARVTNDPKLSGALTDTARKEVAGLSAANATLPQIKAVAKVLRQDMANVHSGINEQIASVKNSIGQNPNAAIQPGGSAVPSNVAAALKGQAPGIHTLSDGSKWMVGADGAIVKQ